VATPARRLAHDLLRSVALGKRTLGDLLADVRVEALDPVDRGFLHELVLGTLRHRGALDHALAAASNRPLDQTEPAVLDALRLGAYQLLRLRVPDHAAVSETVELVRAMFPPAAGFANAVLRRLGREGAPATPDAEKDPLGWLTTAGSLPLWLAERWLARDGAATALARARAQLEPSPATFRLHPRRADAARRAAMLAPVPLPWPDAGTATQGRAIELAHEGLIYLQDLGSQLVARLAAAPGRVLDACAAPGGKSLLMADLNPDARVAALELAPRRLRVLAGLAASWGATNVAPVGGNALRPPFAAGHFDSVLLDAPCSGLGTIGRNPDLRWRSTPADVVRHAEKQRRLLAAVAPLVRPGGRLVYSACTLEPEETVEIVGPFLKSNPEFQHADAPDWASAFVEADGLRVRPERDAGDGFFAAVLRRR
jgi:16S rRNA (cytosine967-C5)-methyltransferase